MRKEKNDLGGVSPTAVEGAGSIASEAAIARHTPTPWAWESIAEKSNEWAVGQAWREDGTPISGRISSDEWLEDTIIERRLVGMNESGHANFADAEFIVRACNSHDELLEALKNVMALHCPYPRSGEPWVDTAARTAIRKAEGRDR